MKESRWTTTAGGNTEFLEVPGGRLYRKTVSEHMTFVPDPPPRLSAAALAAIESAAKHLPSLAILALRVLERPGALTATAREDLADVLSHAPKIALRILKGLA